MEYQLYLLIRHHFQILLISFIIGRVLVSLSGNMSSFMLQPQDGHKLNSEVSTYRKSYCIKINVNISEDYLALE